MTIRHRGVCLVVVVVELAVVARVELVVVVVLQVLVVGGYIPVVLRLLNKISAAARARALCLQKG